MYICKCTGRCFANLFQTVEMVSSVKGSESWGGSEGRLECCVLYNYILLGIFAFRIHECKLYFLRRYVQWQVIHGIDKQQHNIEARVSDRLMNSSVGGQIKRKISLGF